VIDLFVAGIPVPQGSSRAFVRGGRAFVTSANPHLRPWRATLAAAIADATIGAEQLAGPVTVELTFAFPRPASHFGKRGLRGAAPAYPAGRPDIDKCCRAVLDSLTDAGAIRDDAQVVELAAVKSYGEHPGVRVFVRSLEEPA